MMDDCDYDEERHLSPFGPPSPVRLRRAVVYCEGQFGSPDGKTANGLVRHSERYEIVAVIDSRQVGQDAGVVLGQAHRGIPICRDLGHAIDHLGGTPDTYIFGMAPVSGRLSNSERSFILSAIDRGMHIVSGLHEFLTDDPEFRSASVSNNVELHDIRRPPSRELLRTFTGRVRALTCPRIAVLGTDCAIGKRTTATLMARALNGAGIKTALVSTGQTGLIQGAAYGVALDAIPSQFCAGEMEAAVLDAFEGEEPDVILIEGQGALSHPAYSTTSFILRGSCPDGVVLQHAPGRKHRCDFEEMPMPTVRSEITLIETFSDTRVIGLTINHENMTEHDVQSAATAYRSDLGLSVSAPLMDPSSTLVTMVLAAFPELEARLMPAA